MQRKPLTFASAALLALGLTTTPLAAEQDATAVASGMAAAEQALSPVDQAAADFQAAFQAARESGQWPSMEDRAKMADDALADLETGTLDVDQIETLISSIPIVYSSHAQAYDARLAEIAQGDSPEAARAASLRFHLLSRDAAPELRPQLVQNAINSPGLLEAWKQGKAYESFGSFSRLEKDQLDTLLPRFIELGMTDTADMPPMYFIRMAGAFSGFASAENDTSAELREPLRAKLVQTIDAKLDNAELDEQQTKMLTDARARLEGAFVRGKLLNHTAPELNFITWINPTNPDESYAKFSDIKDKVVVIDFWATWCGPCIASFPNVKELQEHYEGYDVIIVGVTSIQGAHYTGDERGKIDCTDDPDKEIALMPEFMQAKDMTWPVAFAQEAVYNPDYGVSGIPHVAILDTQGVVRFRGLHPMIPMIEKTSKIDQLLQEAGKPTPQPPAAPEPTPEEPTAQGE